MWITQNKAKLKFIGIVLKDSRNKLPLNLELQTNNLNELQTKLRKGLDRAVRNRPFFAFSTNALENKNT